MKSPKVSIVIPCLNERKTIKQVIVDAKKNAKKYLSSYEIIVADNGSTDGSLEIIKKEKVRLIKVPVRGYGAALHYGIMNAKGDYVLFADADLSYPFSNLKQLSKALSDSPDMILGSRINGTIQKGAMPLLHRYVGTPILTLMIRIIYAIPTTDCNSGMRMLKKSFYKKLNMRNAGMEWASELLLKTALKKGKYIEVPIRFLKDKRDRKPHLSTWSDGWRHLKAIVLLKSIVLIPIAIMFLILSLLFYQTSFAATFLFLELAFILFLCLATLKLLESVIDKKDNFTARFLRKFEIVPMVALSSFFVILSILVMPEDRLGTKLFLVSSLGILFMWIFLVETIKTHLVNRLPD